GIVYTSADSVFQVAAHEETVPLAELYRGCEVARGMLVDDHAVSRVIARPFAGRPGAYQRTPRRRDFSLEPVGTTLLDRLAEAGVERVGIGKVDDLFAGRGITSEHTPTNGDAYRLIEQALDRGHGGFIFVNVIEFDQTWGHRNDVAGFHEGLEQLDAWMPRLEGRMREDDLIIITADHGNDPTTPSTDHSREAVPILVLGPRVRARPLGERATFADMGATVAEYFGVARLPLRGVPAAARRVRVGPRGDRRGPEERAALDAVRAPARRVRQGEPGAMRGFRAAWLAATLGAAGAVACVEQATAPGSCPTF